MELTLILPKRLTNEILIEMQGAISRNQPFFTYMAHYAVHTPINTDSTYLDNYRHIDEKAEAGYATMIEGVDTSLGRIMKMLEDYKIADKTLLVFYSDNGGRVLWRGNETLYDDYDFNYPLRSGKASLYEGGIRVPAVIRWPKGKQKGLRRDEPVIIEDLYATIASVTQSDIPSNYEIDGKNLIPLLSDTQKKLGFDDRTLFFHLPYRFEGGQFNGPDFEMEVYSWIVIIKDGWKAYYFNLRRTF